MSTQDKIKFYEDYSLTKEISTITLGGSTVPPYVILFVETDETISQDKPYRILISGFDGKYNHFIFLHSNSSVYWLDEPWDYGEPNLMSIQLLFYGHSETPSTLTVNVVEGEETIPNFAPGNLEVAVHNEGLPSKFSGVAIRDLSTYTIEAKVTAKYNSYINKCELECNGLVKAFDFTTTPSQSAVATLNVPQTSNVGNLKVWMNSAEDTRGFKRTYDTRIAKETNVYVHPYSIPEITSINAFRADGETLTPNRRSEQIRLILQTKHSIFNIDNDNICSARFRYKVGDGVFGDWNNISFSGANTYDGILSVGGTQVTFNKEKSYTIEVQAIDEIDNGKNAPIYVLQIPTEAVPFHLGKGGKRVSIGTYCSDAFPEEYFRCEWNSHFVGTMTTDSNVEVGGNLNFKGAITYRDILVDFITENGTSQNTNGTVWKYRRWSSGRLECWTTVEFSNIHLNETGDGKGYGYSFPIGTFNGYPTFSETPIISMNIIGNESIYPITKAIDVGNSTMEVRICSINDQYVSGKIQVYMQDSRILLPVG